MKNNYLITAIIFVSTNAFSQIKVIQNNELLPIGKIEAVGLFKKSNDYTFTYQDINNANLNGYRSFSFKNLNNDVDNLYQIIQKALIDMPDSDIILEFPKDLIHLHFKKNYGENTMQFIHFVNKNRKYVGKSHFLTKNQVDKLFGKSIKNENRK